MGNPEKAIQVLGWKKPTDIDGVIKMMCAEKAKSI
jgi:GDPmannose 4,6-dehydratase